MKYNADTHKTLEKLYTDYHKREYVSPDPLQFLFNYPNIEDREIVGLIASSLAVGRVNMILDAIGKVLAVIPSPYKNLASLSEKEILDRLVGFKYRFYDEGMMASFLAGIKRTVDTYGSIENVFEYFKKKSVGSYISLLEAFVSEIRRYSEGNIGTLMSLPSKGSACKRLNLFMRWMVRKDNIDPGGWTCVHGSELIIPLDVHMQKVSGMFGLNTRKQPDLKAAIEITESLKLYDKNDPVKYDFSLTRPGIHPDLDEAAVLSAARKIA